MPMDSIPRLFSALCIEWIGLGFELMLRKLVLVVTLCLQKVSSLLKSEMLGIIE